MRINRNGFFGSWNHCQLTLFTKYHESITSSWLICEFILDDQTSPVAFIMQKSYVNIKKSSSILKIRGGRGKYAQIEMEDADKCSILFSRLSTKL
jgi:hypothetical protein